MKKTITLALILSGLGCAQMPDAALDEENATFLASDEAADTGGIVEGSPEGNAVLRVANELTLDQLQFEAGLHSYAARNIVERRRFANLAALDATPYVGPIAFAQMLRHAKVLGWVEAGLDPEEDGDEDPMMPPPPPPGTNPRVTCPVNTVWILKNAQEWWQERNAADAFRRVPEGGTILFCAGNFDVEKAINLVATTTVNFTVEGVGPQSVVIQSEDCNGESRLGTSVTVKNMTFRGGMNCNLNQVAVDHATFESGVIQALTFVGTDAVVDAVAARRAVATRTRFRALVLTAKRNLGNVESLLDGCELSNPTGDALDVETALSLQNTVTLRNTTVRDSARGLVTSCSSSDSCYADSRSRIVLHNSRVYRNRIGAQTTYNGTLSWTDSDWGQGDTDNDTDVIDSHNLYYSNYGRASNGSSN